MRKFRRPLEAVAFRRVTTSSRGVTRLFVSLKLSKVRRLLPTKLEKRAALKKETFFEAVMERRVSPYHLKGPLISDGEFFTSKEDKRSLSDLFTFPKPVDWNRKKTRLERVQPISMRLDFLPKGTLRREIIKGLSARRRKNFNRGDYRLFPSRECFNLFSKRAEAFKLLSEAEAMIRYFDSPIRLIKEAKALTADLFRGWGEDSRPSRSLSAQLRWHLSACAKTDQRSQREALSEPPTV